MKSASGAGANRRAADSLRSRARATGSPRRCSSGSTWSGVCHSDYNAIDGTSETRCPAVLGHEGAGVVEAVGERVARVQVGDHVRSSWTPWCGECEECLRDLPQLCSTVWPAMGTGGLMDGTPRLSRDGEPVYHYSFLSTFADACVVPERSCVPIPKDVPFDIAALVGCAVSTGVGAVWRTAQVRPGDRVAVVGCGGVGLSALMAAVAAGAEPVIAVDAAPQKLDVARSFGATDAVLWEGARRRPPRPCAAHPAEASTTRSRPRAGPRPWRRRSSDPCARRGCAHRHPATGHGAVASGDDDPAHGTPRAGFDLRLVEARARLPAHVGSVPRGRLPLDRLISHRLPLDEVERGFDLMHSGDALRVVLDLEGGV